MVIRENNNKIPEEMCEHICEKLLVLGLQNKQ